MGADEIVPLSIDNDEVLLWFKNLSDSYFCWYEHCETQGNLILVIDLEEDVDVVMELDGYIVMEIAPNFYFWRPQICLQNCTC